MAASSYVSNPDSELRDLLTRSQEGSSIFNGLAHWIKGGIFFWYGILTLGRWAGCFGELGWVS